MNTQKFKLGNCSLLVTLVFGEYYPYRASLFNQEGREVYYGEYFNIEQLYYMIYSEMITYQDCLDKKQLRIDFNQMYDTLTTPINGDIRFNLNVTIDGIYEQHTHGTLEYPDINLQCNRTCGEVFIKQESSLITMTEDQAEELYKHLHSVFGELKCNII